METSLPIEFERWVSHILDTAGVARQRPDEWQAIRRTWLPYAPAAASHVGDAAHPFELREVLLALQAAYQARIPLARPGKDDDEDDAMWEFRHRRIVDFVRAETDAYIERVTPRPDIGAIFGRAAARQLPGISAPSGPSAAVRTCTWCGAPRQSESLYGDCTFCGTPFFPRSS